jgi:hypothetical protein
MSATREIVRRTGIAAVVASVADLLVFATARAIWGVPHGFVMLNPLSIIVAVVIGAALAGAGIVILQRVTRHVHRVFIVTLAIAAVLSLAGPYQAMAGAIPGLPRATIPTVATMIVLHLLTAVVIASVFVRGGR